jgi:pyridoxamine 5'-phosphate oxidase family protein
MSAFTEAEIEYLQGQRLGRLATVGPGGNPQNNPVGFRYNAEAETIDIAGYNMGASRKFRNVRANGRVAFVVDDIASITPWRVRGIEIRGHAEALADQPPPVKEASNEIIRIHPQRIITWGIDPAAGGMQKRNVEPDQRSTS